MAKFAVRHGSRSVRAELADASVDLRLGSARLNQIEQLIHGLVDVYEGRGNDPLKNSLRPKASDFAETFEKFHRLFGCGDFVLPLLGARCGRPAARFN